MTKNFGHRGFSGKYPENTMLSFQKAVEAGADGIEMDVQMTKDGELIIMHDELVDRTTDGKGYVKDMTLAQMSSLDASYIYTGKYGINRVPTLKEYFSYVKDLPIVTNIELKTGVFEYPGIEQKVWDMIQEFKLEKKVILSSFNHYTILRMKEIAPALVYGFLTDTWIIDAGKYCASNGVQCYHPNFRSLTWEAVDELKKQGRSINTWTVNREEEIRDMCEKGIDTIIGNFPDLAAEVIKEM